MTYGTISVWETALLVVALVGMAAHGIELWRSLEDRRALVEQQTNGLRRALVASHIRSHALRLVSAGFVAGLALYLMTRHTPPTDHSAPVIRGGLLVIALTLTIDSVLDAAVRRRLRHM